MSWQENDFQSGTATTNASGIATFTFPVPFAVGVVPIVQAIAVVPSGSTSAYNVQLNAAPTNASAVLKVNVTPASISLAGLVSITPFAAAPAGIVVHVVARAP